MALPKEIQRWIRPGDEPSVQAQLLLIMLAGVSDESPDVVVRLFIVGKIKIAVSTIWCAK